MVFFEILIYCYNTFIMNSIEFTLNVLYQNVLQEF